MKKDQDDTIILQHIDDEKYQQTVIHGLDLIKRIKLHFV